MSMYPSRRAQRSATSSRWLVTGALGVVLLVSAACGSSAATPSTTTGAGSVTTSAGASGSGQVAVARVGSFGPVLVDKAGMTLYRYTPDGMDRSVCTGGCASLWPPLTVPAGTSAATGGNGVPSSNLGIIARADGTHQITYKGMPLYTYTGDTKAGEASGQGVGGTWFVVTATSTSSPPAGGTSPSTTAKPSGGYGY
jgi:predicted lipoprotein with Yx(FWY)xxD motif